jgi:hypothetical protein
VRTPRPKPNKLHDELDALLDGRPVELTDELAPLAEVADALRAELAAFELDPEVADRHLERVLEGPGTVVRLPVRSQPTGWDLRRRLAAVVLAAALVLAPATMASAAALPGQAMYPFKRAIEQLRIASVQWSPTLEASERTRVADERVDELEQLVKLERFNQVEPAVAAVTQAVLAAQRAVAEASAEGVGQSEVAKLLGRLGSVTGQVQQAFDMVAKSLQSAPPTAVSGATRLAIQAAVQDSREVLAPVEVGSGGTSAPAPEPTAPENPSENPPTADPGPDPTQPSNNPPPPNPTTSTTQLPTQTTEPPGPSTTEPPGPSTTEPPPSSTEPEATPESGSGEDAGSNSAPAGKGSGGGFSAPTTTIPAP